MIRARKGYIRTLEAFIAFFITFLFVVFVVLKGVARQPERSDLRILENLEQQESFRQCVYANNITCMEDEIRPFIPKTHEFGASINRPDPPQVAKNIFTETVFITSNSTNDYKEVYLYYWIVS